MMVQRLVRKLKLLRQQGLLQTLRISYDRSILGLLRRIYGFNQWHVEAPLSVRPYRHTVADMVNRVFPHTVVEVGCGLGIILSLIKAQQRYGYDLDEKVIRAARFLYGPDIVFSKGGLNDLDVVAIDVLILVNWIHEVSPDQLDSWLTPILPYTRFLLLDAIDKDNPLDYPFKHDFSFLTERAILREEVRPSGEGRLFKLYEVIL